MKYSAIILAVAHSNFKSIDFKQFKNKKTVVFDIKSFIPIDFVDARL